MIEIPTNTKVNDNDFDTKVEKAISAVLTDPKFEKFGFSSRIVMNHARADKDSGDVWVLDNVAYEVAKRFKAKGYFAHYCKSIKGIAYCLEITKYPTNHDI